MTGWTRRSAVGAMAAGLALPPAARAGVLADWSTLAAAWSCPEWFRDAKFGIWAHWGPQCVPEFGDWYGRQMYLQGNPVYEHHVRTDGHPADVGFIDLIGRWKVDKWDPEALADKYLRAGARYVVSMASHHDNFDMFASRHHGWNATRVGPKTDIVGRWAKVVRARGLRFGISNHSSHAWHWWQPAYGYDVEGPRKGERYDAFRLTAADGKGRFWQGLDPQQLYTGPNMVIPDGVASIEAMNDWHGARDGQWLVSDAMTLADITVACYATYLKDAVPLELSRWPALAAFVARCEALDVFRAHYAPFYLPQPKGAKDPA